MIRKVCRKCNKKRYLKFFDKNARMADGHLHACKTCTSAASRIV